MPYVFEQDQLRQEIIHNVAGVVSFWPKVAGEGPVTANNGATYSIYRPDGTAVATGTINPITVGGASQFDIPVIFGGSFTSVVDEGYRITLDWTQVTVSTQRRSIILFDIVLYPYAAEVLVGLSELREVRPSIGLVLERMGRLMGLGNNEEDQVASIFAYQARIEMDTKLRAAATALGTIRPRLILDRNRLTRVERLIAVALIFESTAKGNVEEADDESSQLGRFYRGLAESAWRSLGEMEYDADEDGIADATTVAPGAALIITRRIQGGYS